MATGILFAVLTGISWIWVGVVVSYAARNRVNIPYIQLFQTLTGILISVIVLCTMGMLMKDAPELSARTKWITACSMIAFGILNYFMFLAMGAAMRRGPNGIVWAVVQAGILFPFLMGILVFHVEPTPSRIGGMLLIVGSVILFGLGKETKAAGNAPETRKNCWYLFALLGMLLCGLNQCCANLPSYLNNGESVGSVYRACLSQVGMLCGWLIGVAATRTLSRPEFQPGEFRKILFFAISLNAVGLTANYLLFYNALDFLAKAGAGSLGYPLVVSSCVVGFFLYSAIFLREKSGFFQKSGCILGIAGIVIICL
ncbi:hypothetical protein [Victivallis sp.]|uniref:hypothetical protein n=1 Tax=Victivallis sp. TaxID=2049020 RepID=UPI003A92BDF2